MTKLKKFGGKYKDETVDRIARYFGFSAGLHFGSDVPDEDRIKAAKKTLKEWTHGHDELFVILEDKETAGFVHINYRTGQHRVDRGYLRRRAQARQRHSHAGHRPFGG